MSADPTPTTPSASTLGSATRHPLGTVYLFHFDQRYEHAGHYTGWAEDLDHRVAEHLAGRGARLIEVITQAGISFRLARTWPAVTRARERQLKRQGGASRHCPICQEDRKSRGLPRRPIRDQRGREDPRAGSNQQRPNQWAAAVPTRGTRPERVRAFLALNPGFARPARASQAKQWGGARSREEVELLGPRVTSAAWDENSQPSQHRVATVTRRAVQARLQARQQRSAHRAEQSRNHDLAARTHQRLLARQARQPVSRRRIARDPTVSTGSVTVNAELLRRLHDGRWVQPTSAAGVLGIGAAAFLLSYDALHSLALASGVRPGLARIWPGVLDGFIVVATLTVVAAKRASRPTWYPWALVVLFSAASVAFNILHALDQALAPAGWVAALVFAMPPVALVLATHLLLQQGVWRRQHTGAAAAMGERPGEDATSPSVDRSTSPVGEGLPQPESAPTALGAASRLPAPSPQRPPTDTATRDRADKSMSKPKRLGANSPAPTWE